MCIYASVGLIAHKDQGVRWVDLALQNPLQFTNTAYAYASVVQSSPALLAGFCCLVCCLLFVFVSFVNLLL